MPLRSLAHHVLPRTGLVKPEVMVFDVTHRCTSRCRGCAFREAEAGELSVARWGELAEEAKALGFRELVLTGGEPLAHPEIATLLPALARSLPVALMTNGLALEKHAALVRAHTQSVFVSLDAATDATYRRIRGVNGLGAVRAGIRAMRGHLTHVRVTVWAETIPELPALFAMARGDGARELSLLACDTESDGFGDRGDDRGTPPGPPDLPALRTALDSLRGDPLLAMSPGSIDRLLFLAAGQRGPPRCLAPWTSGVVDPTGHWRHCFFLPSTADTSRGLRAALRHARPERRQLDVATDPTCARCVCWRG